MKHEITHQQLQGIINLIANCKETGKSFVELNKIFAELQRLPIIKEEKPQQKQEEKKIKPPKK